MALTGPLRNRGIEDRRRRLKTGELGRQACRFEQLQQGGAGGALVQVAVLFDDGEQLIGRLLQAGMAGQAAGVGGAGRVIAWLCVEGGLQRGQVVGRLTGQTQGRAHTVEIGVLRVRSGHGQNFLRALDIAALKIAAGHAGVGFRIGRIDLEDLGQRPGPLRPGRPASWISAAMDTKLAHAVARFAGSDQLADEGLDLASPAGRREIHPPACRRLKAKRRRESTGRAAGRQRPGVRRC